MLKESEAELKKSDYFMNPQNKAHFDLSKKDIYNVEEVIPAEYNKFAHFSL